MARGLEQASKKTRTKTHAPKAPPQQNNNKKPHQTPPNPSLSFLLEFIRPLTGTNELIFAFLAAAVTVQSTNVNQIILCNFTIAEYTVCS